MNKLLKNHYLFIMCLTLFCLLLFKDIFSERTLISNLEPFPDTIHYVNSARSLLRGDGLNIVREGRVMVPSVAPLYSLSLVPFFVINNDPRVFYFTNILLALMSLFIFYQILIKLVSSSVVKGFVLILYVTDYFLYWYPNLAMAENLILPLFLISIWLLISQLRLRYLVLAGIVSIGFYATKYASIPLTASFFAVYFFKIVTEGNSTSSFKKQSVFFIGSFVVAFLVFFAFEYTRGNNILDVFAGFLNVILPASSKSSTAAPATVSQSPWFSLQYVSINFQHYWNALTGGSERFLWDFTPLAPKFVAILGFFGLGMGLLIKRFRFICFSLIAMIGSTVFFMCNFYSVDMRYIYQAIPTLLFGFGIFLQLIFDKAKNLNLKYACNIGILLLVAFYLSTNILRIKNQIMLNIKHSETPWYYVSVLELNKYFTSDKILNGKKPIVISPMLPYYIDFYSNGNYSLLPLSLQQEFRGAREAAWGPNDYSDLIKLYKGYLEKGDTLYVANYGLGNEGYLHSDFDAIKQTFDLTEVSNGCFNACNIYRVEFKENNLIHGKYY